MSSVLHLYFEDGEDYTVAICDNDFDGKKVINELDVEKALPLALNEYKGIHFKAVIFIHDRHTLERQTFRFKCQKLCEKYEFFCCFASLFEIMFSSILSESKVMVNPGEKIMYFLIDEDDTTFMVFKRSEISYRYEKKGEFKNSFKNLKKVINDIVEKNHVKKIICYIENANFIEEEKKLITKIKELLSEYDAIIYEEEHTGRNVFDASNFKVLNEMNEKKNPYIIHPMLATEFAIFHGKKCLITEEGPFIKLPYEKSISFNVTSKDNYIELREDDEVIEKIDLRKFMDKQVNVTMKVGNNLVYSISIDPIEVEKMVDEFKDISVDVRSKVVLTNTDYSIFISKNGQMKNLKIYEKDEAPLYICFTDKKPLIGEAAKEILNQKPSFVVYDLIKLCSISDPKDANPQWPFLVKLDKEEMIIIEFETVEGKKKSTPAFLLALVFRDCLSRTKKETGQKINELEIQIVGFKPEAQLIENVKNAAALVNINIDIFFPS